MTLRLFTTFAVLAPALAALAQTPEGGRAGATFVFLGTVAAPASARATEGVEPAVTVRVDAIYFQKGTFESQVGRDVSIVGASSRLRDRVQYVFYADPIQFGDRVTVRLLDLADAEPPTTARAAAAVQQESTRAFARRELQERLVQAELVVTGTVTRVAPLGAGAAPESEHLPDFRVARVKVERFLRGTASATELEFVFAASRDVQWYRAPKFRVGDRGIFLLQRGGGQGERPAVGRQRLTLLNPQDFRPLDDAALVEAVLKEVRP